MSLFDSVASGDLSIHHTDNEELMMESVNEDVLMTEAVYPDSIQPLKVVPKRISLPKGNPLGYGNLIYLYTPSFEDSLSVIKETVNVRSDSRYYWYYYEMLYRGTFYGKRYRYRNFNLRKEYYEKIKKNTSLHPYNRATIAETEKRNMYYELCTYLQIYEGISAKYSIVRKMQSYWFYMNGILNYAPTKNYQKLVVVNVDFYPMKKTLKENLSNPLYMIYYTLYRNPELLKNIDVDFLFYSGMRILKVHPSKLTKDDVKNVRVQMLRLYQSVPKEVFDDASLKKQEIEDKVIDDTKTKLGLNEVISQEHEAEDIKSASEVQKETPTELETSVEKKVLQSTKAVLSGVKLADSDFTDQESKIKAVVQMKVDDDINSDRKILEDAYNKMKHEKVPTSPRSTARNQKLLEEQQQLELHGMTVEEMEKIKAKDVKVKPKDISKAVKTPNSHMKTMTYYERNKTYLTKVMNKDIMNVFLALNNKSIPLYIRDIKVEETSDEMNYKETYTVSLEDANRQRHTLKIDMPKIVENRFLWLGGGKKNIKNQNYFFPVVKTKSGEVQMVSNYNKMYIQRHDTKSTSGVERLKRYLKQNDEAKQFVKFGNANSVNKTGEFITTVEYDELAKSIKRIKSGKVSIIFNQFEVREALSKRNIKEKDGYFCVGFTGETPIWVQYSGTQKTDDGKSIVDLIVDSFPEKMRDSFYRIRSPKRLMVANVKVMSQTITVAMLLGFWEGLETVLRKCHAKYRLEDHMPKDLKASENVIRFSDTFLVYEDTMEVGLLLNGIRIVNTEQWKLTDFNGKEPYMQYFIKVYGKASIANALMNFYEWFVDPITYEICKDIGLPTEVTDLAIYAVSLLADSQHTTELNQRICRVRSFEIIPMVLYGVLANQYVSFRNANGRKKFSIPRDAVIKELLNVNTVEEISTLNPTLELEITHGVSLKGFHGVNLDDAYTIGARSYDKSMTGIIAPSSSPDAGVGLNKSLAYEPKITNLRGYPEVQETEAGIQSLQDVNLFSPGELSMPGAAINDDPTRLGKQIAMAQ